MRHKLLVGGLLITLGFIFTAGGALFVSNSNNTIYGATLGIACLVATVLLILLRRRTT